MSRSSATVGDLSAATEDYLRAILALAGVDGATTVCLLAERLAVSRASVSQMVRRLSELGLVRHDPYREIALTDSGNRAAAHITHRHRLVTHYLVRVLGYAHADASREADQLEHALSERLEARIAAHLGAV